MLPLRTNRVSEQPLSLVPQVLVDDTREYRYLTRLIAKRAAMEAVARSLSDSVEQVFSLLSMATDPDGS